MSDILSLTTDERRADTLVRRDCCCGWVWFLPVGAAHPSALPTKRVPHPSALRRMGRKHFHESQHQL